jgi:hypothetical protein
MSTITTSVGSPGTISAASGGRTYAFNNISTAPQQIIGSNPGRQSIMIHNPGTVDIFIAPASVIVNGSDSALTPSTAALGGCIRVFANGGTLILTGEIQKAYQAFAASGTTNPLTVIDSSV